MLTRLWWKEWRIFGPLWAFVLVVAVAVQWLVLRSYDAPWWRRGNLTILDLSWAALYAFAVSAAAFAGEREHQTLRWLDVLPVDRRTLWRGKASFAFVSTFALAVILVLLASTAETERAAGTFRYASLLLGFSALLVETIAWGLFWSSLLRHVLPAAALAVVCAGTLIDFLARRAVFNPGSLDQTAPLRLALSVGLLGASWGLLARRPRAQSFHLPVPRLSPSELLKRLWFRRRDSAGRSLAWQTHREAFWGWLGVLLLGVVPPFVGAVWIQRPAPELFAVLGALASLLAGVSVFHADNRARGYRFYVNHGVSPAKVWWVKSSVWLLLVIVPAAMVLAVVAPWRDVRAIALLSVVFAFATGTLVGQVIRRGITAAAVGVAALLLLLVPYVGLVVLMVFPVWILALPPLILLGASWAWTGDWMLERSGRWLRLVAWLAVSSMCLFVGQAVYRAWSLPHLGRLPAPSTTVWPNLPPNQDAAELYRVAFGAFVPPASTRVQKQTGIKGTTDVEAEISHVILGGWSPNAERTVSWWNANQKSIALLRQGAQLAGGNFGTMTTLDVDPVDSSIVPQYPLLARLMALDAREREFRGDLKGAWEDVRAVLNMARQLSEGAYVTRMYAASAVELQGLEMGLVWAAAAGQTNELLHAAIDELNVRQERLPVGETIKIEAGIWERTLSRPADELRPLLAKAFPPGDVGRPAFSLLSWMLASPWERERARRAGRMYLRSGLEQAALDPWQRSGDAASGTPPEMVVTADGRKRVVSHEEVSYAFASTPLLRLFGWSHESLIFSADRNVVDRRALLIMLAIRSWQLGHHGQSPAQLDLLVPSELTALPLDPYSGRNFGYVRSIGQPVTPLGALAPGFVSPTRHPVVNSKPGQWLLYSVGPDRHDDRGFLTEPWGHEQPDIMYPVPEPVSTDQPPASNPIGRPN